MTDSIFIRPLYSLEDMEAIQHLEKIIWQMEPIPTHQTLTVARNGGILLGAFDGEQMVGFSYGFPCYKEKIIYLCSHMLGIYPDYREIGLGARLKGKQKQAAIDMGYSLISWTFDPLEHVNAFLNLHKLKGIAAQYIENTYGSMNDKLNIGLPSDRFKVEWWITSDHVNKEQPWLFEIAFVENNILLQTSVDKKGYPKIISSEKIDMLSNAEAEKENWFLPIPINFQQMKKENMELAIDWRLKTRRIFQTLIEKDFVAADVKRSAKDVYYYVFVHKKRLAI